MKSNLQITPSFGARVLITSDVAKDMPLSEKAIAKLVDKGEAVANNSSYIKVLINPTNIEDVYKLNQDSLVMRDGSHKILKEETLVKKNEIVSQIQSMYSTVDDAFKKLFSNSKDL